MCPMQHGVLDRQLPVGHDEDRETRIDLGAAGHCPPFEPDERVHDGREDRRAEPAGPNELGQIRLGSGLDGLDRHVEAEPPTIALHLVEDGRLVTHWRVV